MPLKTPLASTPPATISHCPDPSFVSDAYLSGHTTYICMNVDLPRCWIQGGQECHAPLAKAARASGVVVLSHLEGLAVTAGHEAETFSIP